MIIADHIQTVLWVSGAFTLLPIVVFLLPTRGPRLLFGVDAPDGVGGLFTRHWSLLAPSLGALLIYAAWHPELRAPLMLAAGIEKAGLVGLIVADWMHLVDERVCAIHGAIGLPNSVRFAKSPLQFQLPDHVVFVQCVS